jgi:hypothetical protein
MKKKNKRRMTDMITWLGGDCVERANVRLVAMMAAKA